MLNIQGQTLQAWAQKNAKEHAFVYTTDYSLRIILKAFENKTYN